MTTTDTYDMRCPFCGTDMSGSSCSSCGRDLQVLEGIRSSRDWAHVDGTIAANKVEGDVHSMGLFVPKGQSGTFMKTATVTTVVAMVLLAISVISFISFVLLLAVDTGATAVAGILVALLALPALTGCAAAYVLWKHRKDWSEQQRSSTDA